MVAPITTLFFCGVLAFGQADGKDVAEPTIQEVQRAISQLQSKVFSERQLAMEFLFEAGRAAEDALRKAAKSADREVAFRAKSILDKFDHGIFANTPPDIVQIVQMYRRGSRNEKQTAISQLQERGEVRVLLALLNSEKDESLRSQLTAQTVGAVQKLVPKLLLAGDSDDAEQLLELASSTTDGLLHYVTYLELTGKTESKIEKLVKKQTADGALADQENKLLLYLYRAKGDRTAARRIAEVMNDDNLVNHLAYEMGDWELLSARASEEEFPSHMPDSQLIERFGFHLAYHRLAGEKERLGETVTRVKKLGEKANMSKFAAEAFLINARPEDGIEQLRTVQPADAFRLLCAQSRYRDAFALLKINDPDKELGPWFDDVLKVVKGSSLQDDEAKKQFAIGVQVPRALARLGVRDEAETYFQKLADAVKNDEDGSKRRLRNVISVEYNAGLRNLAIGHASDALDAGAQVTVLQPIFSENFAAAQLWRKFFAEHKGLATKDQVTRCYVVLNAASNSTEEESDSLIKDATEFAATLDDATKVSFLHEIAELCLRLKRQEQAVSIFEQAAKTSAASAIKLGDFFLENKEWQKAATWYENVWQRDKSQYFAMFLKGYATHQLGDEDRGNETMRLAEMLPLSRQARRTFATKLKERGLTDESLRHWEIIARTSPFQDWYGNDAAKNIGNIISGEQPRRAADNWEPLLFSGLKTASSFTEIEGYLKLPQLIHKVRARALLKEENVDDAIRELRISQSYMPGGIELPEDFIPQLDKLGRKKDADVLFEKPYGLTLEMCEDYPKVATHHNNLAWLAARCGRKLDEALTHANRAVKLRPDSAAYLDTLAEVHFQRGDRAEAIRLAKKCLELEPEGSHFKEQLERFEGKKE